MNSNEPTNIRYVGKGETANANPQEYQADSFERPQIKAHFGVNKGDNFKA
ncbi:MAG: hypothetical protein P8I03_07635 [Thalassotalea sp.]|nr:hypothetical protein [Thalassotalea sp.]